MYVYVCMCVCGFYYVKLLFFTLTYGVCSPLVYDGWMDVWIMSRCVDGVDGRFNLFHGCMHAWAMWMRLFLEVAG